MTAQTDKRNAEAQSPDLILIHGFRGAPLGLEAVAHKLRQAGYKVYLPAVPPFAEAKLAHNLDYSPENYAQYLRDYIEKNNLAQPVLIGHSMGSLIAAATAKYYPDLVNHKLILLAPISVQTPRLIARLSPLANYLPTNIIDYITTKFLFIRQPKSTPTTNHTTEMSSHDFSTSNLISTKKALISNSPSTRQSNKALFRAILKITHQCSTDHPPSKSELSAAMQFSTKYAVTDFLDQTKDITCVVGDQDRLVKLSATKKLAEQYHAELSIVPHSGHLLNYEQPHLTAQYILQALHQA